MFNFCRCIVYYFYLFDFWVYDGCLECMFLFWWYIIIDCSCCDYGFYGIGIDLFDVLLIWVCVEKSKFERLWLLIW